MTTQIDPQQHQQHPIPPFYYQTQPDDEIDLRELWMAIWQGKWWILLCTVIFTGVAVGYALYKPNIYRAEVLLAPSSGESNKMGALASQFGGLASLAGISLNGGGDDKTQLALAILQSRDFITDFMRKNNLLVPLFAGKEWDQNTGELLLDDDIYSGSARQWVRKVKQGMSSKPTDWEAYKEFKPLMQVSEDKKSGFVTLSIEFLSPVLAKEWVDGLVNSLNLKMKTLDLNEADKNISYLQQQLEKTQVADMQNVFFQLIEEQMKTKMLAEVQDEYVFKVVDPSVLPEEKAKPKRTLIAVLGVVLGFMIGIMLTLVRYAINKNK